MAAQQFEMGDEEIEALKTLVEVAVKLKESGMLDMLRVIAEKGMELLPMIQNDIPVQRAAALADAALRAIERLSPEETLRVKLNTQTVAECTFKALASVEASRVKPVGMGGMLSALRDKDVQTGLGLLLAIAKALGACIRSKQG